jgi:predicted Fe-Mo cluster-binding NifX family protein
MKSKDGLTNWGRETEYRVLNAGGQTAGTEYPDGNGAIMKIAVTSTGKELTSDMDPRFGRAAYFLIVDSETMEYEAVDNKQNFNLPQGAGIQAGKTIVDKHADVLITGNCGPKAFLVLEQAGVKIVTGAGGKVKDVVLQYKNGELKAAQGANVEGHWA